MSFYKRKIKEMKCFTTFLKIPKKINQNINEI